MASRPRGYGSSADTARKVSHIFLNLSDNFIGNNGYFLVRELVKF